MKRIIAVLLTLMMALSLTACSGDDNAKVAGTWKWNCDITELFQEGVNQGAGMDLSTDATMEMVFVLKLNEDGTYTLNVDRDALKTSLQTYIDALIPVAVEMIYQQLEDQGMNRADIDEAMAAEGVTVKEYVQQMMDASIDVDQMMDGLADENESGYFRAAKGKLYLSDKTPSAMTAAPNTPCPAAPCSGPAAAMSSLIIWTTSMWSCPSSGRSSESVLTSQIAAPGGAAIFVLHLE